MTAITPMIEELKAAIATLPNGNLVTIGVDVHKQHDGQISHHYIGWSLYSNCVKGDTVNEVIEKIKASNPLSAKLRDIEDAKVQLKRLEAEAEAMKGGAQ